MPNEDGENGAITPNRIGAFLDRMSPHNSPIGFERPQGRKFNNNLKIFSLVPIGTTISQEDIEKQIPPFHIRGRADTPTHIGGNWAMITSGEFGKNYFTNGFEKIIIFYFLMTTILPLFF
jgi:hypothetical protein